MRINPIKIAGAIARKIGIQTKAEKQISKEVQEDLQKSIDELDPVRHFYIRQNDGSLYHGTIADSESAEINNYYANRAPKIPNINNDENYNRHTKWP